MKLHFEGRILSLVRRNVSLLAGIVVLGGLLRLNSIT